jgi:hypothetical protein
VARAILLGRLRTVGRMKIAMSASISHNKGRVITRESFNRMLAELHPDTERAGTFCENIGEASNRRQKRLKRRRRFKRHQSILKVYSRANLSNGKKNACLNVSIDA